jgi:hypothetical protein
VAGAPTWEEEVAAGRAASVEPSAAAPPGLEWPSPDPGLRKEAVGFEVPGAPTGKRAGRTTSAEPSAAALLGLEQASPDPGLGRGEVGRASRICGRAGPGGTCVQLDGVVEGAGAGVEEAEVGGVCRSGAVREVGDACGGGLWRRRSQGSGCGLRGETISSSRGDLHLQIPDMKQRERREQCRVQSCVPAVLRTPCCIRQKFGKQRHDLHFAHAVAATTGG